MYSSILWVPLDDILRGGGVNVKYPIILKMWQIFSPSTEAETSSVGWNSSLWKLVAVKNGIGCFDRILASFSLEHASLWMSMAETSQIKTCQVKSRNCVSVSKTVTRNSVVRTCKLIRSLVFKLKIVLYLQISEMRTLLSLAVKILSPCGDTAMFQISV